MKSFVKALMLGAALLLSAHGHAQTTAPAASKAVVVANPMAASAPGATAATAPAAVKQPAAAVNKAQAPGGGDGKVWVNTASNVYHCAGTRYYGKTKAGLYMTESEAKAKGNHANKGCP